MVVVIGTGALPLLIAEAEIILLAAKNEEDTFAAAADDDPEESLAIRTT